MTVQDEHQVAAVHEGLIEEGLDGFQALLDALTAQVERIARVPDGILERDGAAGLFARTAAACAYRNSSSNSRTTVSMPSA